METKSINWEQRRYETARELMTEIMGRANYNPFLAHYTACPFCSYDNDVTEVNPYDVIADMSVKAADALIVKLKGECEDDV